ncbi:MAG: hypothetical protein ACI9HK_006189 [Pirellulaceae bacterium]|jgi:hypothetical protein
MAKYYIESGDLKVVVEANGPVAAAERALSWITAKVTLDRVVTINERGFIRDRENRQSYASDIVLETGTLMCMIGEYAYD